MPIHLIAAISANRVIGCDNRLPWSLPVDLRHFRETTSGHSIIMGRKTWESIGSKPLPNRQNIVLTSYESPDLFSHADKIAHSIDEAVQMATSELVYVIGGSQVFNQTIDIADGLVLTVVDHHTGGDAYFPRISDREWSVLKQLEHPMDSANKYRCSFYWLEKRQTATGENQANIRSNWPRELLNVFNAQRLLPIHLTPA